MNYKITFVCRPVVVELRGVQVLLHVWFLARACFICFGIAVTQGKSNVVGWSFRDHPAHGLLVFRRPSSAIAFLLWLVMTCIA